MTRLRRLAAARCRGRGEILALPLLLARPAVPSGPGIIAEDGDCRRVFEGKALKFAGKLRAGFDYSRRELVKALKPHITVKCPFVNLPYERYGRWGNGVTVEDMKALQWVKLALAVQVSFMEWTAEGRLRHPSFLGVRAGKNAIDERSES